MLQRGSCGDGKCDQHRSARTNLLRRTAGGSARGLPLAEWAEVALEVECRRLSLSEQLANPAPPSAEFRMLRDACGQAACCASQAAAATAGSARFMRRALDGADVPSGGPVERRSNVSVNERPLRRHSDLIACVSTATWACPWGRDYRRHGPSRRGSHLPDRLGCRHGDVVHPQEAPADLWRLRRGREQDRGGGRFVLMVGCTVWYTWVSGGMVGKGRVGYRTVGQGRAG